MARKKPGRNKADRDISELRDSARDKERMNPDEGTLDLPDVKDIPGQEYIRPPRIGEMEDTTISSADEEGKSLLDDVTDNTLSADKTSDVSSTEAELLGESADTMPTRDQINLKHSLVDNRDNDGELLNEEVEYSGRDLDVPGSDYDDENEDIGEEDEENNFYSNQEPGERE